MIVDFFRHDLGKAELDAIENVIRGPILTTGETVKMFEERFSDYLKRRFALGVNSCTGAIHLSLLALGVGQGDEVITTPMTFIATATGILEAGAKPVFVDVEPETGNIDVSKIEAAITERTRAIVPVHLYGQMCDMRSIREIADKHHLFVVEDSAHCVEGVRDGVRPGELGDTACFSFYATKNLTCGEGGALVTDNEALIQRLRLLHLHGMTKTAADRHREGYQHWDMTILGWKYNMSNLQAAMLLPQMDRLDDNWSRRESLSSQYQAMLAAVPGIAWPKTMPGVRHAHHLFPIWITPEQRDLVVMKLQESGIGVVVNYRAIHLLSYFRETFGYRSGDFPAAERIGDSTLSLPFYPSMPRNHIAGVVDALKNIMMDGK